MPLECTKRGPRCTKLDPKCTKVPLECTKRGPRCTKLVRSRTMERLHPVQHAFVFAGLEAADGVGAVLSVSTLLDRLDALENGTERKATRTEDRAAIATLTARGITSELRAQLRGLIQLAQTVAPPEYPADPAVEERDAALVELRAWYKDWTETARAVITRKDYLVMLGLSKRRASKADDAGESAVDEVSDSEVPVPTDERASPSASASSVAV